MSHFIKLYYFDFRGRAESTRILFNYAGIKYEDVRFTDADWPQFKPKTPFGKIPVLEIDGKMYVESKAMTRYAAEQANLVGNTSLENLEINAVVDLIYDLEVATVEYGYLEKDEERKKILLEKMLKETIPSVFTKLDATAKENNYHLAVNRFTWADVYFANFVEIAVNELKSNALLLNYPNLNKVLKKVVNNPKIKEYLKTRADLPLYKYDIKSEIE